MDEVISKERLRQFLVNYHNLNVSERFVGIDGIRKYFKRVGSIQYDPISVVGRNADLVLQSKVQGYKSDMLQDLLYTEHELIDGYDKEMCIYRADEYSCFAKIRAANGQRAKRIMAHQEQLEALELLEEIRMFIRENGVTGAKDISMGLGPKSPQGSKKLSTVALDYLYRTGELLVSEKRGVQKYYDYTSNILTNNLSDDYQFKDEEEFLEWYIKRRIQSVGALWEKSGSAWLGHYISDSSLRNLILKRLSEKGEIFKFYVEGIKYPFYLAKEDERFFNFKENKKRVKFLAPLDNLLWDREMIEELFDFEYSWEVYTPIAERKYGYYVLPIIYGTTFIGRFEAEKLNEYASFTIKNWWWEPEIEVTEKMLAAINRAIIEFSEYLGVPYSQNYMDIIYPETKLKE